MERREDIQVFEAVIREGKPAIRIETARGEKRKNTAGINIEYIVMSPGAAKRLGRKLLRLGRALECEACAVDPPSSAVALAGKVC